MDIMALWRAHHEIQSAEAMRHSISESFLRVPGPIALFHQ